MEIVALVVLGAVLLNPRMFSGLFGPPRTAAAGAGGPGVSNPAAGQAAGTNYANGGPQVNAIGTGGQQQPGGTMPKAGASDPVSSAFGAIGGIFGAVEGALGISGSPSGSSNPPKANGSVGSAYGTQPGQFDSTSPGDGSSYWNPSTAANPVDDPQGTAEGGLTDFSGDQFGIDTGDAPSQSLPNDENNQDQSAYWDSGNVGPF